VQRDQSIEEDMAVFNQLYKDLDLPAVIMK
ncbi:MAG: hypothetical protein ACI9DM_000123, partial [Cyclobacteriaceae bacterium]